MLKLVCFALLVSVTVSFQLSAKLESHWEKFKSTHKKSYSGAEEEAKKEIFRKNVEQILSHNLEHDLKERSHTMGINEFSDMTHEEFKSKMLGLKIPHNRTIASGPVRGPPPGGVSAPQSRDWRQYLTPIKNQGSCGSCWTFSVTGALEGHVNIQTGQQVVLSEQNLLDCSSEYGNNGCSGGYPDYAFQYIQQNGGVDTEDCYMYEGSENQCRYDSSCIGATISGFQVVSPYEDALMEAVGNRGPVAVGMDAGQPDFMQYSGGIYDTPSCSSTHLNHAVVVVGYGDDDGEPYWLLRNSWGTSWGEQGYFRIARGDNRCGLANTASYPIL